MGKSASLYGLRRRIGGSRPAWHWCRICGDLAVHVSIFAFGKEVNYRIESGKETGPDERLVWSQAAVRQPIQILGLYLMAGKFGGMKMCYYTNLCAELADWWFAWGPIFWMGVFIGIPVLAGLYALVSRDSYGGAYVTPMCSANRQPYTARNRCNDVVYTSHKVTGKETAPFKVRPDSPFYIPQRTREKVRR